MEQTGKKIYHKILGCTINHIWSVPSTDNHDPGWLSRVKQELADVEKQDNIKITVKSIQKCVSGMSNWKFPGLDSGQGFCYKRMTNLHN